MPNPRMNEPRPPGQRERYWNRAFDGPGGEGPGGEGPDRPEAQLPRERGGYREHRGQWQFGGGDRNDNYGGIGPKNYRRSDQRIFEDVCDWLTEDLAIDAANIEVTVQDAEVTLTGTVRSRQMKRWVRDLVEKVHGVRDVHNQLRIAG